MGSQRRGKKQKQGPRTLSKEEATGRVSKNVLESRERTRQEMSLLSNPLLAAAPLLASIDAKAALNRQKKIKDEEGRYIINADASNDELREIADDILKQSEIEKEHRNKSQHKGE